jgi:hypothetical protein
MNAPAQPSRRHHRPGAALLAALLAAAAPAHAQNLLANGNFDHPQGPLFGWITDYAWTGNQNYAGNKDCVTVKGGIAELVSPGTQGAKLESLPIPFEPGFRYTCTLEIKGGPYRIYFAGYKWKPGVRPHDNPELGELRMIYKSKALDQRSPTLARETLELPGVDLSTQAKTALKEVRFITLYVWMLKSGSVDKISIIKTADPKMKF